MIRLLNSVLFLFLNILLAICGTIPSKTEPALLVVSYDAFRPDYLNRNVTPNMNKFRKEGTSAPFMMNVFPTKTFVNHFTIATGLYADTHGVLANELYDTKLGKKIGYSYDLFHYSNSTVPIWTANEKAGKHSGCMMWTGSNFDYNGIKCTFEGIFDLKVKWEDRVDTALSWFAHEKTPANLVMLYIEEPDEHAHAYGPESDVITQMVAKLDNSTGYIQKRLIETGLDSRVNVIHLSDHGMSSVSPPNFIDLTKFVATGSCEMYGTSPILQIIPTDSTKENEIFQNLTKASKQNGHFKVYNNKNIPVRWHANNTRRMGPIIAVADVGYGFQDLMYYAKKYEKDFNIPLTNESQYGVHGYDNEEPSMHAIFMAKGPLFSKGKTLKSVNMIDLYNLFCLILNIQCDPTHGSAKLDIWNDLFAVKMVKAHNEKDPMRELTESPYLTWILLLMVVVFIMFAVVKVRQLRREHDFLRNRERSKVILTDFEVFDDDS